MRRKLFFVVVLTALAGCVDAAEIGIGYHRLQNSGITKESGDKNLHHIGDRFTIDSAAVLFKAFPSDFGLELTLGERWSGGWVYRFPKTGTRPEISFGVAEASMTICSNTLLQDVDAYTAYFGIGLHSPLTDTIAVSASYKYTDKVKVRVNESLIEWNERYFFIGLVYLF